MGVIEDVVGRARVRDMGELEEYHGRLAKSAAA